MTDNPFLSGNFAPVDEETTAFDLPVTGQVPRELEGRLLRIGPSPVNPVGENHHWFLGNGLVHGVRLRGGRADWYRSRFVRDDEVAAKLGAPPLAGARFVELGSGVVNTNVIGHAGRTWALVEAGTNPIELDYELESVARSDFDGTLPGAFSAHPKRDPDTGELHVCAYFPGWDYVQYIVVGTDAKVRKTVNVPVPGRPMIHDCSITENWFIVMDLPVLFDPELIAQGFTLPYHWDESYGARVGLLPREGGAEDIVWCEVDPCYVFHPLNSYEDADGRVVFDVVRHPKMFASDMLGPNEGATTLERWLVDPRGGPVKRDTLSDRGQEFPRHDERRIGKPYRFGYCGAVGGGVAYGGVLKHDLRTGQTLHRDEGAGRSFQEPVFVPRAPDADEDDGWIMAYVHDADRNAADVVILHAQDFLGEPVATVHLPTRVPFGFHGNWVADA